MSAIYDFDTIGKKLKELTDTPTKPATKDCPTCKGAGCLMNYGKYTYDPCPTCNNSTIFPLSVSS